MVAHFSVAPLAQGCLWDLQPRALSDHCTRARYSARVWRTLRPTSLLQLLQLCCNALAPAPAPASCRRPTRRARGPAISESKAMSRGPTMTTSCTSLFCASWPQHATHLSSAGAPGAPGASVARHLPLPNPLKASVLPAGRHPLASCWKTCWARRLLPWHLSRVLAIAAGQVAAVMLALTRAFRSHLSKPCVTVADTSHAPRHNVA